MTIIHASIGTISHGTLRTADLLETFAGELESLVQRNAQAWCSDEGRAQRDKYMKLVGEAREVDIYSEAADDIRAELEDALQEFAPPNARFGAHEGDGADFGFWPTDCECGHGWHEHVKTPNGAYACKHHGCGCKDVVAP